MLAPSGPKHRYLEVNTVNEERWREGVNERQKQKEDIPSVTDSCSLHFPFLLFHHLTLSFQWLVLGGMTGWGSKLSGAGAADSS